MNLELAEFVVMPNHFHGIIMIGENKYNRGGDDERGGERDGRGAMHRASATPIKSANKFGPQSKNLASIVRGYKSAVTTHARKNNIAFDWQPRFHDHIIRSMDEYHRVANYILNNPNQWGADKFYKD